MAKYIIKDGRRVKVSEYDLSLMLTFKDIIPNDPKVAKKLLVKKEGAPAGKLRDIYNTRDNSSLIRKIFINCLKAILVEVASGNCQFYGPGRGDITPRIYVGEQNDNVVRAKLQNNQLKDIDIMKAKYKAPLIMYNPDTRCGKKDLGIYVNQKIYKELIDTANEGFNFSTRPKSIDHFIPYTCSKFSYIREDKIEKIVKYCFTRIRNNVKLGEEIRIIDGDGEIRFFRILGKYHDQTMREVVKRRIKRERNKKYGTSS